MKKKLQKDILQAEKEYKTEEKLKTDKQNELLNLEEEIKRIENHIQKKISEEEYEKLPKIENINNLYNSIKSKDKDKRYIEVNLEKIKAEKKKKEEELEEKMTQLLEKVKDNDELIIEKKEKLENLVSKMEGKLVQRNYIITPERIPLYFYSQLPNEIEFMNSIKNTIKSNQLANEKIIKDIDLFSKKLGKLKVKKDSECLGELSTTAVGSSNPDKNILQFNQKNESLGGPATGGVGGIDPEKTDKVFIGGGGNKVSSQRTNLEKVETLSSISMEIEDKLILDNIPSEDSIIFMDKVIDNKSKIEVKPLKKRLSSLPVGLKFKHGIRIGKPIDYNIKTEEIEKEINIIKENIETTKNKICSYKEKKINIDKESKKIIKNIKHADTKIKIIKEQIDLLQKQINDFNEKKENSEFYRTYSINNIINNHNYYNYTINDNINISELETNRKPMKNLKI